MNAPRIRYLNLLQIRLPLPGVVSILHRISGVLLVVALPIALYCLQLSLANEKSYAKILQCLAHPFIKLALILFAWAFFHHLFAGIRFLLLDIHIGVTLALARRSSWLVVAFSLISTAIFAGRLW